jgi:hypothetical protein
MKAHVRADRNRLMRHAVEREDAMGFFEAIGSGLRN